MCSSRTRAGPAPALRHRSVTRHDRDSTTGIYDGKAALITGGSSGFGLATAATAHRGGARVIITGRTQATLDRPAGQLGADVIAVRSDTASLADIDALADRVRAEFGALDLLLSTPA